MLCNKGTIVIKDEKGNWTETSTVIFTVWSSKYHKMKEFIIIYMVVSAFIWFLDFPNWATVTQKACSELGS